MAFKNIFNLLKRKDKRKKQFAGLLDKEVLQEEKKVLPVLDDIFVEESTGIISQWKKYPWLNFAEFVETQKTSFSKNSAFVIEILEESVNVAIVSRKGIFLDVGFLRTYSYEKLKEIFFQISPIAAENTLHIKDSIESIISIVAYDVVYSLPKKIIIIDSINGDLKEISVVAGRFGNLDAKDIMLRELAIETDYVEDDIEYSEIAKPNKKNDKYINFIVSFVDKIYYNKLQSYLKQADFTLKKHHSLKSSMYASFSLKDRDSVMRIHIDRDMAYILYKIKNTDYEYTVYNIQESYEELETISLEMQEIILSGYGNYYEMIKSSFLQEGLRIRYWNYSYDMKRCTIRLEEGLNLTNQHANLLSTAYYELFNMRLALIRLGVGAKLSIYEFISVNLSMIPVVMVILATLGSFGWYLYEKNELNGFNEKNKKYTVHFQKKKAMKSEISRKTKNIKSIDAKIKKINDVMKKKFELQDATILYELARKLPDDLILTRVSKQDVTGQKYKEKIIIEGRCYLEKSLFSFMKSIKLKDLSVYLTGMRDTQKTTYDLAEDQRTVLKTLDKQSESKDDEKFKELYVPVSSKIVYADTLNNSFTLEIR